MLAQQMSSLTIALISAACIFGGVLLGLLLQNLLPGHHLSNESKETVKLGAGMIATLSALVLGLLVSSAKNNFDTMNAEITQSAAKIIQLDRVLGELWTGNQGCARTVAPHRHRRNSNFLAGRENGGGGHDGL